MKYLRLIVFEICLCRLCLFGFHIFTAEKIILKHKPTESKHSSQIGYISIGVIVCVVVAIVLLDVKAFNAQLRMMKKNLNMNTDLANST